MKTIILFVILTMAFASCDKNDNGILLNVSSSQWYTSTQAGTAGGFCNTKLVISGSTNADKVTVETHGDGVISEQSVLLDSKKNFTKNTVAIAFLHYSDTPPGGTFEMSTVVRAIKGLDTLKVTVKSGTLKY